MKGGLFGAGAGAGAVPEIDFDEDFSPVPEDGVAEDIDGFEAVARGVFDASASPESRAASLREAILQVLAQEGR